MGDRETDSLNDSRSDRNRSHVRLFDAQIPIIIPTQTQTKPNVSPPLPLPPFLHIKDEDEGTLTDLQSEFIAALVAE